MTEKINRIKLDRAILDILVANKVATAEISVLWEDGDILGIAKELDTKNYLAIFNYIPDQFKYEAFKLSYTGCSNNSSVYKNEPLISEEVLEKLMKLRPEDELKEWDLDHNNQIMAYSGDGYKWVTDQDEAYSDMNEYNLVVEGVIKAEYIITIINNEIICLGDTYDFVNITYAYNDETGQEFDESDAYDAIYDGIGVVNAEDEPEENEQ